MVQELRLRCEEWTAKQPLWTQLHEELACSNVHREALERQLQESQEKVSQLEALPPRVVTETVTVVKVCVPPPRRHPRAPSTVHLLPPLCACVGGPG